MVLVTTMSTAVNSASMFRPDSVQSSDGRETKKYLLMKDTVAKCRPPGGGSKSRLLSKRSDHRVLKGSLWQEIEGQRLQPVSPPPSTKSINRSASLPAKHAAAPMLKLFVESIEIEDLTLACASSTLAEISADLCSLLLAIPTSEERYYIHSDVERMNHAKFINVGSDVIVSKRNVAPCRAMVKWKGRLAGKQGIWFGVEIMDEQSRGSGDSDGSINNVRLFRCEKNNGMVVNIAQLTLVPPKRPMRRPKKKAPSTPSLSSENNFLTNGSQTSDQYTNDLVSQTESELSFFDDINSAETAPLVTLQVGDRVLWPAEHGQEKATVRWIGTIPDEEALNGEILVGVEFDNAIGKGTGRYKNHRLFESKRGHASLVPLDGLIRQPSASSLRNPSDTSSQHSLSHTMQEFDAPMPSQTSAADVLASLAIDDNASELESSDHNNNSSGRGSLLTKQETVPEAFSASPPQPLTDLSHSDHVSDQSFDVPSSSSRPEMMVNGTLNSSASSSDNLGRGDNFADEVDAYTRVPITQMSSSNHLPVGRDSHTDTTDNNSWSDSTCSTSSEHIAAPKHVRPSGKGKITSYHMPKGYSVKSSHHSAKPSLSSRNKAKTRNGLVKAHSLDVKDMHEIADDLELNSSNDSSLASSPLTVRHVLTNGGRNCGSPEVDVDISHRRPDLLARLSNSPPPVDDLPSDIKVTDALRTKVSPADSPTTDLLPEDVLPAEVFSSPIQTMKTDNHSTAVLSPLMERTTPVSFSSLDNQTESQCMMSSDITVVPAPLEAHSAYDCDNASLEAVPYAPPEFAGDTPMVGCLMTGLWKGIASSLTVNSGFIEALLYLLSVSTDLLVTHSLQSFYPHLKQILLDYMAVPLRNGELVEASVMASWKEELDEISTGRMLSTANNRELNKFITLVLQHIISIPPLYELNNGQAEYAMNLVACKDARIGFPTVQKLFEMTCIQQNVKLLKVPDTLILILSRSSNNEMIFPNQHIDLTDALEYARRICNMCGDRAVFECPECFEHELNELSSSAYCESCSQTVHRHSKRANHLPIQLKIESECTEGDSCLLWLKGVLTARDGHYTSLSQPTSPPLSSTTDWLYFDGKAYLQDATSDAASRYIPEVTAVAAVTDWLSMEAYEQVARDVPSIPDNIQRILKHCCLCVYSKS